MHISTSHTGGAGIAARRLNFQLNRVGVNSHFYAIARDTFSPLEYESEIKRSLLRRLSSRISSLLAGFFSRHTFFSLTSTNGVNKRWIESQFEIPNTVLHIHNWFNLLSQQQLLKLLASDYPIVLTMHDHRLLTGGCHTPLECNQAWSGCSQCPLVPRILWKVPRLNSQRLSTALRKSKNKTLVSPSNYLKRAASQTLSNPILHIPNLIPLGLYQKNTYSKRFAIDTVIQIGIASLNVDDYLKGGDIIEKLQDLSEREDHKFRLIYLRDFSENDFMSFWQQIDCLLVPSRNDNSPNVIHEAKVCGVPVIATLVGGIPELLKSGFDVGIPASDLSVEGIIRAIDEFRKLSFSEAHVKEMKGDFESYLGTPVEELLSLYQELLRQSRNLKNSSSD